LIQSFSSRFREYAKRKKEIKYGFNDDEDNENFNDENEKDDIKNIMGSLKHNNPIGSFLKGGKSKRGYHTTKNNIKKPLKYFKVCDFCGRNENICNCAELFKMKKNIQNVESSLKISEEHYSEIVTHYFYKKKPPTVSEVKQNLQELKNYSIYQ